MQTPAEIASRALDEILSDEELFHVAVNGVTLSSERAHDLLRSIYNTAQVAQAAIANIAKQAA